MTETRPEKFATDIGSVYESPLNVRIFEHDTVGGVNNQAFRI
jgi:hypothetical protein